MHARSEKDRKHIEELMRQVCSGIALAHGVDITMSFNTELIEAMNTAASTQSVIRVAKACGPTTMPNREPISVSENFAHFSAAAPGCFLLLGNGDTRPHAQPLHSNDYDFNDALLPIGAVFWTARACDRLPEKEKTAKIFF